MVSKKNVKTIDELLEDALVPEDEQPYPLSEGWIWIKTSVVGEIITGSTPSRKNKDYYGDSFAFFKPADLNQADKLIEASEYLSELGYNKSRKIPIYSTLVCCIGSIGKAGYNLIEGTSNQQINTIIPNQKIFNNKFVYYCILNDFYQKALWDRSSATTISIINKGKMGEIPFVFPPLNVQKKIVTRLDNYFKKIDEAKQLIEEAKKTFEIRRAATLDKAFCGELTKEFRKSQRNKTNIEFQNNAVKKFKSQLDLKIKGNLYVLPEGWKWVELNDLIENMTYGSSSKTNDDVSGTPIIRMGNIQDGKITKVNYKYLPNEHPDVLKLDVQMNDILFNRTNSYELVGKSARITEEFEGKYSFASYLIRLRLVEKDILAPYIVQFINSHIGREMLLSMVTQQVGQANINSQKLASLMIPLPTIEEIKEINKRIKELEDKERNAIKILELDSTVNNLKQSILSKAFKGELDTNDPNDESAIELLKLILEEKL